MSIALAENVSNVKIQLFCLYCYFVICSIQVKNRIMAMCWSERSIRQSQTPIETKQQTMLILTQLIYIDSNTAWQKYHNHAVAIHRLPKDNYFICSPQFHRTLHIMHVGLPRIQHKAVK